MKRISIPEKVRYNARCVVKNTQQGEVGEKFRAWNKTCVLTSVVALQAMDASKLWKECGYYSVEAWKKAWLERHLFAPKAQDIVFAHYFKEV